MSGLNLEKDTVLSSWTSGRPPDSVMDFRLTLDKVKRDCLRRPPTRSMVRTSENSVEGLHLCEGLNLENATRCFHLDFWKTARFRHGFPTDF